MGDIINLEQRIKKQRDNESSQENAMDDEDILYLIYPYNGYTISAAKFISHFQGRYSENDDDLIDYTLKDAMQVAYEIYLKNALDFKREHHDQYTSRAIYSRKYKFPSYNFIKQMVASPQNNSLTRHSIFPFCLSLYIQEFEKSMNAEYSLIRFNTISRARALALEHENTHMLEILKENQRHPEIEFKFIPVTSHKDEWKTVFD